MLHVVSSLSSIYENSSISHNGHISVCIWFVILCAFSSGNSETDWTVEDRALNSSWNFDFSNFGYSLMESELSELDSVRLSGL